MTEARSHDDFMAVAMAREIRDGDFIAHGTSVPLAAAALALAKRTHAPNIHYFFQGTIDAERVGPGELQADMVEIAGSAKAQISHSAILDLELRGKCDFHFIRPIQVSPHGDVNGSLIGSLDRPKMRFHGIGLGDVVGLVKRSCIYVTEHSPRVLTEDINFRTGRGHGEGDDIRERFDLPGGGPVAVVTPLGVLDFETPDRSLRARSLFPGVSAEQIVECTGFEIDAAGAMRFEPKQSELRELDAIDPLRARRLEFREWREETRLRLAEHRRVGGPHTATEAGP